MAHSQPLIFGFDPSFGFAKALSERFQWALGEVEEREFEDGEFKTRALTAVRGRQVFVIQSLSSDQKSSVNDKLVKLLVFLGSLRDAGAQEVTLCTPFLPFARKDRRTKSQDPLTTRYLAQMVEAVGVNRVVTVDPHNLAAFQNSFRIEANHLIARDLLVGAVLEDIKSSSLTVVSPDTGGVKRAESFRKKMEERLGHSIGKGFMEKFRSEGELEGETLVGDCDGRDVIVVDDLISSGGTLARAAQAAKEKGARRVVAAATHGLFVGDANWTLQNAPLEQVYVTNSLPMFRLKPQLWKEKIKVVDLSELISQVVYQMALGEPIEDHWMY